MRRSFVLGPLVLAGVVFAAGWIGLLVDADAGWALTVENVGLFAVTLAGAAAGLVAWRDPRQGATRRPFLFLGLGSFAWGIGQAAWTIYTLRGVEIPFPSLADVGYLASLPFFAAGIVLWPRRHRLWTGSAVFDAMLAVGLAALLSYKYALEPILQAGLHSSTDWFGLAYPLGDFLVVTVVVGGLLLDGWAEHGRLSVVGAGLLCLAAADTIFALDVGDGTLLATFDPMWAVPFGLLAVASTLPRRWPSSKLRGVSGFGVPFVVTVLVGLVAGVHGVGEVLEEGWAGVEDFGFAGLLVLVAARALYTARMSDHQTERLRTAERELLRAQASRDRFLVELVNAQEIEARKIADLLHDEVVQQLTALGFRLELEAQRHQLPKLTELAHEGSAITASIRRLLVELHPAVLESQGLGPAIDAVAEGLRERGVDVRVSPFPHRLPRELETLTYRLVQEALGNVQRHSHALYAEVEVTLADGTLRARISDTGSGTLPDRAGEDGLGLQVARERVELAGGRFLAVARPGNGTDVMFELPLPESDEAAEAAS
jgi:signal transduction histidine kinase